MIIYGLLAYLGIVLLTLTLGYFIAKKTSDTQRKSSLEEPYRDLSE